MSEDVKTIEIFRHDAMQACITFKTMERTCDETIESIKRRKWIQSEKAMAIADYSMRKKMLQLIRSKLTEAFELDKYLG